MVKSPLSKITAGRRAAYLKLWEALTLLKCRPAPGEICLDLGGSPGRLELGLTERKALITGASPGIGRACAEVLAEEGCDVVLVSRTAADLEAANAKITAQHNVAVRCVPLDLSDSKSVHTLAAECPETD